MIDEIVNNLQRIADRKCYPEDVLDGSIAQEWIDYIGNLEQENKQLKEDKKKAREFIEDWCTINPKTGKCVCYLDKNRCTELYKILGDKE